jgi:hypothetical protein
MKIQTACSRDMFSTGVNSNSQTYVKCAESSPTDVVFRVLEYWWYFFVALFTKHVNHALHKQFENVVEYQIPNQII